MEIKGQIIASSVLGLLNNWQELRQGAKGYYFKREKIHLRSKFLTSFVSFSLVLIFLSGMLNSPWKGRRHVQ